MAEKLDAAQRKEFIAGYSKLLTAAWSASDFNAFIANITADPATALADFGLTVTSGASVEIKTAADGSEGLDQAVELWEAGVNGGVYTLYVIHDDHLSVDPLDLTAVTGAGSSCSSHSYCCSCCPCCSCT
jgi:hypothetical protein